MIIYKKIEEEKLKNKILITKKYSYKVKMKLKNSFVFEKKIQELKKNFNKI